jgi:hypothetical protein
MCMTESLESGARFDGRNAQEDVDVAPIDGITRGQRIDRALRLLSPGHRAVADRRESAV